MSNKQQEKIDNSKKIEFLYFTLNSFDGRRTAVDSRANVILLVSSAILAFVTYLCNSDGFFSPKQNIALSVFALIIIVVALIVCTISLLLINPISRSRMEKKERQETLSWFYLLADVKKNDYANKIMRLDDQKLINELSNQMILISKLLKKRYDRLQRICTFQFVLIGLLVLYLIVAYITNLSTI